MPCVLLHGLEQDPGSWDALREQPAGPADAVVPDLTAMLKAGNGSYPSLFRALEAALASLPAALDLCGLSLGGVLALHYAAFHPRRVRSLVLIAAQFQMPKRLMALQDFLFRVLPERFLTGGTPLGKAELLTLTRSMTHLDLTDELAKVSCPTLVLCGERDRPNLPASRELAALLPRAVLRVIPGAGHQVNTEAPEQLARELQEFWKALPQTE